ncbi:hypothetical protein BH11MYX2_BH11MYX2_13980 [soil metagenome]
MGGPRDSDLEIVEEPVEREGRDTLLPPVTRSVMSSRHLTPETTSESAPGMSSSADMGDDSWDGRKGRGAVAGDVIGGRYIVESQLGRGGMGRVLRVKHSALGKEFALKVIKSRIATNPKIREMFYREARLASALTHQNICSIVDFGQDAVHGLFMVMELLDGQTVHAKLRQTGRFSPKVACDVMWQVADAMRFIHSRSILHGDIKTENIFMVKTTLQRRLIKLLDFGLARPDLGQSEGMDGTPEYVAPERIDGAAASQASDIYALGIVFFELLTGSVPFTGKMDEVLRMHREVPVPAPSKLINEPLDERADELIARATHKDPTKRHPDIPALMYELRALMTMLGMDQTSSRRRALAPDNVRERREIDNRLKAAAEVFSSVAIPMASIDSANRIHAANAAFGEFLGCGAESAGLALDQSALPGVYPTLFEDLEQVRAKRRPVKRVLYLNEGGDRVVEAAVVLSCAPSTSEVTAGGIHIVIHPLRSVTT